jgi:hypothetical protein
MLAGARQGCYQGASMRAVVRVAAVVASTGLGIAASAAALPAAAPGPSRSTALEYAKRSYLVLSHFGNVPFRLGAERSVTAEDGSTITAYVITSNPGGTADSFYAAVMFFRDRTFLGWASSREEMALTLEPSAGRAIRVEYPIWRKGDATCCPSGRKLISYSWDGSRLVASGQPPLIYGEPGALLHLAAP